MITFFNNLSKSWVAKIILGLLLLSMIVFWGFAGLTNLSFAPTDAIKVGKISVTPQQITQSFEQERKNLSRQIGGQYISPAQALEFGLLEKVLQTEIQNLVKHHIKEDLGLAATNEAVKKYVESNPLFHDATGKFDKNHFYAFLSQKGLSETMLAHELKDTLAYNHLRDTINDISYTTKEINTLSYLHKNEQRNVSALFLKPSDLVITKQPSEEDLKNYYEGYSENFMKPEFRKINLLSLTPETMHQFITINDEEINNIYNQDKEKYVFDEEREILQIFFKTEEDALKELNSLTTENFLQTAQRLGQTDEATLFGWTKKNQLAEELQEAVFAAPKNTITKPIASQTGWHVFYIKDIKEETSIPENTAKEEIKKSLISNQAYDKLTEITRKVEDMLGEGKSLTDVATTLNLPLTNVEHLDIAGVNQNGEKNELVTPDLMKEVFVLNKSEVSPLVEHNNGYLLAEIIDIDPVGVKDFNSVKDEIIKLYIQEEQNAQFESVLNTLKEKAQKGESLETLAKGVNAQFMKLPTVSRNTEDPLFKSITPKIFSMQKGFENAELIVSPNKTGAALIIVNDIIRPSKEMDKDLANIDREEKLLISDLLHENLFNEYINKLNVKVYNKTINQIISMYKTQE